MKTKGNYLIENIETFELRSAFDTLMPKFFELRADENLVTNLSGWAGALFIRAILFNLKADEHRIFRWRIENKYIQYLIFNHYIPGSMPETVSLTEILDRPDGIGCAKELFKKGFFLKATLGHGSGRNNTFDRTMEFDYIIPSIPADTYENESWIIQRKIDLKSEFRIHSFNKEIIDGVTFLIQGKRGDYSEAQYFVINILEHLPKTITEKTLIAWDIGYTTYNQYYIIEANFTGYHPEFKRGFQTTGYIDQDAFGPIICTWLNHYFKLKYQICISCIEENLISNLAFFRDYKYYNEILTERIFKILFNKPSGSKVTGIVCLGNNNTLLIRLIVYFIEVKLFGNYILIVKKNELDKITNQFDVVNDPVEYLAEENLFSDKQYQLISMLGEERRKRICSYHALRHLNVNEYVIL